jgi:hypothetical protein
MAIPFHGRYTREELVRFDRAVRRAFRLSSPYSNVIGFGIVAAAAFVLLAFAVQRDDDSAVLQWLVVASAALGITGWSFWSVSRAFAKHPHLDQEVSGTIGDEGLEFRMPGNVTTREWSSFSVIATFPDQLLLIGTANEAFGMGRTFFRDEQEFAAACELARSHVSGVPSAQAGSKKRMMTLFLWMVIFMILIVLWNMFQQ